MVGGLIFVGVVGGLIAFVIWAGRDASKLAKELPDRLARARPAKATVVSIAKGGVQNRGSSVFSMRVLLTVEASGGAYEATAFWEVRDIDIPQIQPGTVLDVKVDADEPIAIYSTRFSTSVGTLAVVLADRRKA